MQRVDTLHCVVAIIDLLLTAYTELSFAVTNELLHLFWMYPTGARVTMFSEQRIKECLKIYSLTAFRPYCGHSTLLPSPQHFRGAIVHEFTAHEPSNCGGTEHAREGSLLLFVSPLSRDVQCCQHACSTHSTATVTREPPRSPDLTSSDDRKSNLGQSAERRGRSCCCCARDVTARSRSAG
jgi:hypothetical protein